MYLVFMLLYKKVYLVKKFHKDKTYILHNKKPRDAYSYLTNTYIYILTIMY